MTMTSTVKLQANTGAKLALYERMLLLRKVEEDCRLGAALEVL